MEHQQTYRFPTLTELLAEARIDAAMPPPWARGRESVLTPAGGGWSFEKSPVGRPERFEPPRFNWFVRAIAEPEMQYTREQFPPEFSPWL